MRQHVSLQSVLRGCVGPLAREHGWRRSGQSFRRDAASGDAAFFAFRSFDLMSEQGFYLRFGVCTAPMIAWLSQADGQPVSKTVDNGLLLGQVTPPPELGGSRVDPRWSIPADTSALIDELAGVLTEALLPGLVAVLERDKLINELRRQGAILSDNRLWTYPGVAPVEAAEILAVLDDPYEQARVRELLPAAERGSPAPAFAPWVQSVLN